VGFVTSLPFASISDWFLAATIPLAVMTVPPVLYYSGVWPNPVTYLIPTQGPLLLFGDAFHQISLAPWQILYTVSYPALCLVGLWGAANAMFVRFVVAQSGGM
jgi:fluoroquinolone transport system permease protein